MVNWHAPLQVYASLDILGGHLAGQIDAALAAPADNVSASSATPSGPWAQLRKLAKQVITFGAASEGEPAAARALCSHTQERRWICTCMCVAHCLSQPWSSTCRLQPTAIVAYLPTSKQLIILVPILDH